jgi:hypothetical protein
MKYTVTYLEQKDIRVLNTVSRQFRNDLMYELVYDEKIFLSMQYNDRKKVKKICNVSSNHVLKIILDEKISTIKCLTFSPDYNYKLPEILPCTLTNLTFGRNYNQRLPEILPRTLTSLTFGYHYNHPLPLLKI